MFRYDCSAIWMKTCNESRRFTRVCYFLTSGGILHDKIADFLIKEQCSPKSSWNISAKHQESWWQLYKGMLWVFKLKKRPCARQKRREPYQILHSVLSIYMKSIGIVWDLDFLLFFRASILCTPWPHPFICYVQDPSNKFQFALLGQVYPDITKLSSTEMDIYPSFYAQGVASQPQTLRHRVAKTLARSGSSREGLWRSSPGGWVQNCRVCIGDIVQEQWLCWTLLVCKQYISKYPGYAPWKKCSEVEPPWQALTNIDVYRKDIDNIWQYCSHWSFYSMESYG